MARPVSRGGELRGTANCNLTQPLSCSIIALKALQMLQIGSREVSQQLRAARLGGMRFVDESGEN